MTKMGLPSHIHDIQEFENVLLKIGNTPACCGLKGQIYTQTKYPALKAAVETVCDDLGEQQQLLRSLDCSQLVPAAPGAKVVRCTKCDSLRSAVKQARWRREKLKRVTGNESPIPAKKTRWDYLSEEEKKKRYNAEQSRRIRADDRAEYHKDRYATLKETIRLAKEDHEDMVHVFNKVDSDVTKLFPREHRKQLLWKIQREHVENNRNQWNTEFLDVCLQLWQRSKQGYADLKDSGFLQLPSERLLQYKKNTVNQRPGLHTEVFQWMAKEAEQQGVTERGRHGLIVFDEMKIQGSVQLRRVGDEFEIAGLVDMGAFYRHMQALQTAGEQRAEMATHVFQVAFKGCEGFFFPFAWYPTCEIAPISIFNCHWDSVFHLQHHGFFSHACLCDGGQANRDFIIGHFGCQEDAIREEFKVNNLYGEGSYSFIMDPPHNIKKLRNNLEKSTLAGTARCFKTRGKNILWAHLKEAYLHDKTNARAPVTSCKIKDSHFQLTPATRMRNHLAADIFSDDMLELLDNYQEFKRHQKGDADSMRLTREYVTAANIFMKTFANTKPIRTMDDPRLVQLDGALQWFLDWNQEVKESVNVTSKERNKSYISDKLHFDLCSMVLGFKSYVHTMTTQFPGIGLVSAHTNQDALENMFGCVRASNGSNTNPTILQYGPSVNGYIHCRSFKVRNGNASRKN